jgi:hypothetical protein
MARPAPSGLADVIEIILGKGLVIDAYVRVSVLGIELLTLDARIVVSSVDTYLRFAEATNRLDLEARGGPSLVEVAVEGAGKAVQAVATDVVEHKVEHVVEAVEEKVEKVTDVAESVAGTVADKARELIDKVLPDDESGDADVEDDEDDQEGEGDDRHREGDGAGEDGPTNRASKPGATGKAGKKGHTRTPAKKGRAPSPAKSGQVKKPRKR